jgi:hypothetical protein
MEEVLENPNLAGSHSLKEETFSDYAGVSFSMNWAKARRSCFNP